MIDAHQHFWQYSAAEYGWIGERMPVLRRDYLPPDLAAELRGAGVTAAISVQARQSVAETDWLLSLAAEYRFIAGVVGWAPLAAPDVAATLERWRDCPALKGLRHVVQDEPDDAFLLRPDFNRGLRAVTEAGLVYDILIYERQLPQAIRFVDLHPNQIFVLDHIAKPRVKDRLLEPWRGHLRNLARRPNVYCKLSGIVTEADWQCWSEAEISPYWDAALAAFGPARLMFGSDWPVLRLAAEYRRWFEFVRRQVAALSTAEQAAILGGTARRAYRLSEAAALAG